MNYEELLNEVLKKIVDRAKLIDNWKGLDELKDIPFRQQISIDFYQRKIDYIITDSIFHKLFKDGYLKTEDSLIPTIEGIIFSDNGGYINQKANNLRQIEKSESLMTLESRIKSRQLRQSLWLIVFGSTAAIYYALEIVKFIKNNPNFFCGHP